ncbi:SigE family RNA polymerase sigma factor [Actinoplanes sp. NPDC049118]|uniref:SigE family RNA polymerase sigma factor n=1 Tax=Actinoplanes sp. NPDC049118 TaxID=3155769 RepID=UPI0033DD5C41
MTDTTFDEFLRQALPGLARYAYVLAGDRHAAEDLLQDSLVKAMGAWPRIRQDGNPVGYVRTIMARTNVSRWRRRRPSVPVSDALGVKDVALEGVEHRDELRRALATLSPLQRTVLVLGFLDGAEDEEIAQLLHRRPATVRSLRHRALQSLRRNLRIEEPRSQDRADLQETS